MANLGRKWATVAKRSSALTGYGTALTSIDGDEIAIMAPTMRGLELVWNRLNTVTPLDKSKVRRVVYFPHESLTTLQPRKGSAQGKSGDSRG